MRFQNLDHDFVTCSSDKEDWFMKEQIKQRNREDRKKQLLLQKKSLSDQIVKPNALLKTWNPQKQKLYKNWKKEELNIVKAKNKLDFSWKKLLDKKTSVLRDKTWAIQTLHDDVGLMQKYHLKNQSLHIRKKKNFYRLNQLI